MNNKLEKTIAYLSKKQSVLLITTSNRWSSSIKKTEDRPKSSLLAETIQKRLGSSARIIDVTQLKIYPCEGNVSAKNGNTCGIAKAKLLDGKKNPSGHHRCWASINNSDDQLWKISKELLKSDCVVFFASVRWGQLNSYYQTLIERLTWLENRHATLGEHNLLKEIDAGIIVVGQNWNGKAVITTQKKVLGFYGFNVVPKLCWNWQYTQDVGDETKRSYINAFKKFREEFLGL